MENFSSKIATMLKYERFCCADFHENNSMRLTCLYIYIYNIYIYTHFFVQDRTLEQVVLRKRCCVSYSWYDSSSSPLMLRLAQFHEERDHPDWTSSFSPSDASSSHVLKIALKLPSIEGIGSLNVSVLGKGGMQNQVMDVLLYVVTIGKIRCGQ